jgi:hypothetical protein
MARTTIRTEDITASAVTAAKIASGAVDTAGLEDDIALLGFKVASNGSLAKYNLVDQTVDAFEDTSGVDASASTDEVRDSSGKYYSGATASASAIAALTTAETSTWTSPSDVTGTMEILVVAGGGGTGHNQGGGGGAGGVVHHSTFAVASSQAYGYTVGAGGSGGSGSGSGSNGSNSIFDSAAVVATITSIGGGGGGGQSATIPTGGGSGGGGSSGQDGHSTGSTGVQGDSGGGTGYGNDGGDGSTPGAPWSWGSCGGGGGANANGGDGTVSYTGVGGAGKLFSTFVAYGTDSSNVASTGSNGGYFGGGGGGGDNNVPAGAGGVGGGGSDSSAGLVNTGGGGGGGDWNAASRPGGTGVILLSYDTGSFNNMTLVSTTTAAQAAPTKGDVVFTYTNGAGTTTLGTDVTAEISADGGSTWTAMTLGSEGSTGAHNIATAHDVTISSTITSPWNMAYRIKTLNQSASKTTRIQAVSLGWS